MSVEFNENEIKEVMNRLSKDMPIFHSEDDFIIKETVFKPPHIIS